MMRPKSTIASAVGLSIAMLSSHTLAQDINLLPEGQTLITLSVTERINVEQDTLIATLRIEGENRDAGTLQREINAAVTTPFISITIKLRVAVLIMYGAAASP